MSSLARLEAILENEVSVLCCTPTYALRLGEVAAEEGLDLSRGSVRTILVAGEPGGSIGATVAAIERLWPKGRVVDHHGMTETGPVSYGCPREPHRLARHGIGLHCRGHRSGRASAGSTGRDRRIGPDDTGPDRFSTASLSDRGSGPTVAVAARRLREL